MNLEGQKISGSRNWAVYALDFLSRYDPDPLRYYLTANMPETRDLDWDWEEFYHRNNDGLLATWGNLVNRVLSFAYKNFDGKVPDPGSLAEEDLELMRLVDDGFRSVAGELESVHMRSALGEAMRLATEVNRYLDITAPWSAIKTDRVAAARSIFSAIHAIDLLKIMLASFLPHTCERLHTFLGYHKPLFGKQSTSQVGDALGTHTVLTYDANGARASGCPARLSRGGCWCNRSRAQKTRAQNYRRRTGAARPSLKLI